MPAPSPTYEAIEQLRYIDISEGCPILKNKETVRAFLDALPEDAEFKHLESRSLKTMRLHIRSSKWPSCSFGQPLTTSIETFTKVTIV